jgi:hypothetical protein
VLSWLIFGYGVLSLVSFSIFSYIAPEYIPLGPRLIYPLLQVIFVVAAWLLVKRMKLALPLFAAHLFASFFHVANGAPELLFTPEFLAKWVLSLGILTFVILRWRQGALK